MKSKYDMEDSDGLVSYVYWGRANKYGQHEHNLRIFWDTHPTPKEKERVLKAFTKSLEKRK